MARLDPHSYADDQQPQVEHLDWRARVDFPSRTLAAEATLRLSRAAGGPLDLDTRGLSIERVQAAEGPALSFTLGPTDAVLGERLRIELAPGTRAVCIRYRTAPGASALQWLSPEQTEGKAHPFLFTQCQAIHARSLVPLQDTPRVRLTYDAQLTVPADLRALMAAAFLERQAAGAEAVERYEMREPIPPYLFAFAVGHLAAQELGPRSRVWAEPERLADAAWEFASVDAMLSAAEALFGPYPWGRFDLLTMPPSFPYGGMENPRLTFLTPTLLAKDRSLVNVVAHELSHSWTGNLVTNASLEDFWLNEGFTVFAERRLLEALEGREAAELHAAIGYQSLLEALQQFEKQPELTRLRTHLAGVDPDEVYSQVPYEKGYLFLAALEQAAGRERFSSFLRTYAERFRFQSITTDDFLALARSELPGALEAVGWEAWVDGPGIPKGAPIPRSAKLTAIEALGARVPDERQGETFGPLEWQIYLKGLEAPLPLETLSALDGRFGLTQSSNWEVRVAWLTVAARSGYPPAIDKTQELLGQVGRMKYLRPLYQALASREETKGLARATFERYRTGYHPIAAHVIAGLVGS